MEDQEMALLHAWVYAHFPFDAERAELVFERMLVLFDSDPEFWRTQDANRLYGVAFPQAVS